MIFTPYGANHKEIRGYVKYNNAYIDPMTDSNKRIIHPTLPPELQDFAPVPRHGDSAKGWSPARQKAFIAALAETGRIGSACAEVESPLPVEHR